MTYYQTNSKRLPFFGHISFGVKSLAVSEPFYTAIFAPLGLTIVYSSPKAVGYGWADREPFTLFEEPAAAAPGRGTHFAFNAPSRKAVDKFYEAALRTGGKGNGAPGVRVEYHENYYACFVYDPDGHRLEALFQQPVDEREEA